MTEDKVYIIGVAFGGPTSLLPEIHRLVNDAEIVFGGKRLLDMFPSLVWVSKEYQGEFPRAKLVSLAEVLVQVP